MLYVFLRRLPFVKVAELDQAIMRVSRFIYDSLDNLIIYA